MFIQRILAAVDRVLASVFRLSSSGSKPGKHGAHETWSYYELEGPRVGALLPSGFVEVGGMFETCHDYDEKGKLLRRYRRWEALPEGSRYLKPSEVYVEYDKARRREGLC